MLELIIHLVDSSTFLSFAGHHQLFTLSCQEKYTTRSIYFSFYIVQMLSHHYHHYLFIYLVVCISVL